MHVEKNYYKDYTYLSVNSNLKIVIDTESVE